MMIMVRTRGESALVMPSTVAEGDRVNVHNVVRHPVHDVMRSCAHDAVRQDTRSHDRQRPRSAEIQCPRCPEIAHQLRGLALPGSATRQVDRMTEHRSPARWCPVGPCVRGKNLGEGHDPARAGEHDRLARDGDTVFVHSLDRLAPDTRGAVGVRVSSSAVSRNRRA